MTQPPGFLQGFIPTEIVPTVPDSRSSHLLQPHVRQRARRRSRANRSSIQLVHEAPPALAVGASGGVGDGASAVALGRSREMPPTAQITVDAGSGDSTGVIAAAAAAVAAAAGAAARLEDAKLKGLEENYSSIGENFECNICFQKANEAVVTCCGHLFCWPCLYRWLHIHSYHKECPVCKGAIDESTITPIYGRECSAALLSAKGLPGGSAAERIPPRPPARRVESARQMREREDRGREREQRERAERERSEREREQQQSESRGLAEVLVGQPPGVMTRSGAASAGVTAASLEEGGGGMMRDSSSTALQSVQGSVGGGAVGLGGNGGEITISSSDGDHQLEEIDSRDSAGFEDTSSSGANSMSHSTGPPGVNVAASSFQDPSTGGGPGGVDRSLLTIQLPGGGSTRHPSATATNIPISASGGTPAFLQRRVSDRREQLRAALAASARSSSVNLMNSSTLGERVDDRRQVIAAAALLSQEWEDIMNISRLVGPVNPVQAAAWMAAVQGGRFGNTTTEGTSLESFSDFPSNPHHQQFSGGGGGGVMLSHSQPIHRSNASSRHMFVQPTMISQDGRSGGDDSTSLSRLISVNPLQAGDWLAAMRTRLTSMEKIVENLDSPLQVLQQHLNLLPAQSSVSQGAHLSQTRSDIPAPGLEELSLLNNLHQPSSASNSSSTDREGPSCRAMEERAAAAVCSEPRPSTALRASSSSTSTSAPVQNNARTHSEPRLHYRETPVPKPPTSRRRTSRPGEEGITLTSNSSNTGNGGRNQGHDVAEGGQTDTTAEGSRRTGPSEPTPSSSRSKRRRTDN